MINPASWPICNLPGLDADEATQLATLEINTTADLLRLCLGQDDRHHISQKLHIPSHTLDKWVALAKLAQLPSVGCQYCGVLLHSGVASTHLLSQLPIAQVHRQILRFYVAQLQRPDLSPSFQQVSQWIREAQQLRSSF